MIKIKNIITSRDFNARNVSWEARCDCDPVVIAAREKVEHWAAKLKENPCEVYQQTFNRAVRSLAAAKSAVKY